MGATATTAGRVRHSESSRSLVELARGVDRRINIGMLLLHGLGGLDVFLLLFFVLPSPAGADPADHLVQNLVGMAVYLPLSMALGMYLGNRLSPTRTAWVREGRDPTPEERTLLLSTPLRCLRVDGGLWLGAAILFAAINLPTSLVLAKHVALTVVLGGLTVCAVAYLMVERVMRPITAVALASGPPPRPAWPGVEGRLVFAWLSATGIPIIGLIATALDGMSGDVTTTELARAVLVLGLLSFALGLTVTVIVARTVSEPLTAVRRALSRVQAGDLSAEVRVDDGSEVGLLQSGFNQMVAGLRERERMQDLYSRQVGEEVARAALDGDPRVGGGERREVAVLFVDVVGSTKFADRDAPERLVARLNRFFAIVVDVVAAHGGWVNKFEGDAALCVFGAPGELEDPGACALAAGRDLDGRLRRELPNTSAGIGLSAGPAVAGWVGAEKRFEYTVIGDPVNEASRLCELAKRLDGRLLASKAIIDRAGAEEAARWRVDGETILRGRSEPTRLAAPVA